MEDTLRLNGLLEDHMAAALLGAPPTLAQATRYAVFPGGGRVRSLLALAVGRACGDAHPRLVESVAVAVELLHCASLAHDDLPCFDDADLRRGRPSVHRIYGEPLALLVGDGLIVAAYGALARGARGAEELLPLVLQEMAQAAGPGRGLVAGQAWESEPNVELHAYHRAKTGALFEAAVVAGALAGGGEGERWRVIGRLVGEVYQLADDLADALSSTRELGKPTGQDAMHGRPSATSRYGVDGALQRLRASMRELTLAVPQCQGHLAVRSLLTQIGGRLVPAELPQQVPSAPPLAVAAS